MSTPEAPRDVQLARTVHDRPEPLTIDDLRRRPTITIREYAAFIGVSSDCAYEAAARGELRVLHLGRRVLVPTAPVLEALGIAIADPPPADGADCGRCRE